MNLKKGAKKNNFIYYIVGNEASNICSTKFG